MIFRWILVIFFAATIGFVLYGIYTFYAHSKAHHTALSAVLPPDRSPKETPHGNPNPSRH